MSGSSKSPCPILVGTSGYGYNEWVGKVYPEGSRPEQFLTRYASMFSTVELNFSYYKMPTAEQCERLLEQAGEAFTFAIKGNEALTHKIDASGWKEAAKAFLVA